MGFSSGKLPPNNVTLDDAQTLSNKSLDNTNSLTGVDVISPERLDVKQDTLANLETYALTASNGQIVFATDTKQMFEIKDNALVPLGSSTGGLDVFHTERFEQTQASDAITGNDAAFLGGGSIVGTVADETVAPLKGNRSLKYTQAVGSAADYFALPAFSVDLKERGQLAALRLYTTYSGNNNEIDVVIYDATNNNIIFSTPLKASTKSLLQEVVFEVPETCTSLQYGFQTVIENDGAVLVLDDIEASVNPLAPTEIFASSVPTAYTPTISGFDSVSSVTFSYTRNGKYLDAEGRFTTGTTNGDTVKVTLPSGLTVDENFNRASVGVAFKTIATAVDFVLIGIGTSDGIFFGARDVSAGSNNINSAQVGNGGNFASGEAIYMSFRVPIQEWTNTAQGVSVKGQLSTDISSENVFSATINGTNVLRSNFDFIDSVDNPITGRYIVTFKNGVFSTPPVVTGTTYNRAGVYSSGMLVVSGGPTISSVQIDIIDHTGAFYTPAQFDILVAKQGSDYVKESEKVYTVPVDTLTGATVEAFGSNGQNITNPATEFLAYSNVTRDTANAFDGTTYTVQKNNSEIRLNASTIKTGDSSQRLFLIKNGIQYKFFGGQSPTNSNMVQGTFVSSRGEFAKGDTIAVGFADPTNVLAQNDAFWSHIQINEDYGDQGIFLGQFGQPTCYVKNVQPSGTNGGTASATGSFNDLVINTTEGNCSFLSLASNTITLESGGYDWKCEQNFHNVVNNAKIALVNTTDGVASIIGLNTRGGAADDNITASLMGHTSISSSKDFKVRYRVQTTASSDGLGTAASFSVDEVYLQCKITKVR